MNRRWLLFGVLALSAVLVLRPVAAGPLFYAIGSSDTEAPRHFWGLWATAAHLWDWGPFVAHLDLDYPTGYTRHLMDPINLVPFLPAYWLAGGGVTGAVLGYNLVHVFWAVVGGLGAWLLTRRLVGNETAALLAAFACATAPYLMATPYLGRTEMLPGVGYPLHLFFLHRALSRDGRATDVIGAGLSLAAVALGGWYLASWLALLEPPLALWFASKWPVSWGRRIGRISVIAVLSILPVVPALWALFEYPPPILGEEQRVSAHMGICTPPQLLLPFMGNTGLPGTDLPAYPGTVLFVLAVFGAVVRREARVWLAIGVVLLAFSLGPFLVFSNDASLLQADPFKLPAYYLEKFLPPIRFIWGWCRLGILVTWPLALAAAYGLPRLLGWAGAVRYQLLVMIFAAIAVDHVHSRAPAGVNGHAFDARPPAGLVEGLAELGPGAIVQLPLDDFYMTWQLAHGRPIAESLEIEDVRGESYLVQKGSALITAMREDGEVPVELLEDDVYTCVSADTQKLGEAGYAGIVIHRDRLPDAHLELTQWLTRALGRPVHDSDRVGIWAARGVPTSRDCPVEVVKAVVPGE